MRPYLLLMTFFTAAPLAHAGYPAFPGTGQGGYMSSAEMARFHAAERAYRDHRNAGGTRDPQWEAYYARLRNDARALMRLSPEQPTRPAPIISGDTLRNLGVVRREREHAREPYKGPYFGPGQPRLDLRPAGPSNSRSY